jgi:MFS family permease
MGAYFFFHFAQMFPAALFPIFWVREANLTDGEIALINALFYVVMLVASPSLGVLSNRFGNHRLNLVGAILLGLYPLLTALSTNIWWLIAASVIGGGVWAILSGSLANRLFELIPDNQRPSHLAMYNLSLNIATLSGTMLGPVFADLIGLREAMLAIFLLRVGSGLALARWG